MPQSTFSQLNPASGQETTHKLVKCEMRHANGKSSLRFISLEVFLLWAHMMRTRHNMECKEHSICLWVPAADFEHKSGIFSHSGQIEPVNRFEFQLFDATYNYPFTATRFVPESDSERFRQAMLSHIPPELQSSNRFGVEMIPGYCIEKEPLAGSNHLVLGLYNGLDDIY